MVDGEWCMMAWDDVEYTWCWMVLDVVILKQKEKKSPTILVVIISKTLIDNKTACICD